MDASRRGVVPMTDPVASPGSEGPGNEAWQRAKLLLADMWSKERQN